MTPSKTTTDSGSGGSGQWQDDYDHDNGCANCGGEGFTLGCSWDWQCDTYDAGEGTCLCERPCDWCRPPRPHDELHAALAEALSTPTKEQ